VGKNSNGEILEQIAISHEIFVELMDRRLPELEAEDLERYFAALSRFLGMLEDDEKELRQAAREMAAEAMTLLLDELAR
jgi:hypothetical protein